MCKFILTTFLNIMFVVFGMDCIALLALSLSRHIVTTLYAYRTDEPRLFHLSPHMKKREGGEHPKQNSQLFNKQKCFLKNSIYLTKCNPGCERKLAVDSLPDLSGYITLHQFPAITEGLCTGASRSLLFSASGTQRVSLLRAVML